MAPEVGVLHGLVVADVGGFAGREDGAFDEDSHVIGDFEHEVHVVFDQKDGVIGGEGFQKCGDAVGFFLAHAGERFVEQQNFGFAGERHGDFKLALGAVGERAGDVRCGPGETSAFQACVGAVNEAGGTG